MTLTPLQVTQIMAAITGNVDPDILVIVKRLLDGVTMNNPCGPGESYADIKTYSQRLLDRLTQLGTGIAVPDPMDDTLLVYMDIDKVKRLMAHVPADGYLAALPGIHNHPVTGTEELTISLLGCGSNMEVLPAHINSSLTGEEAWGNCNIMQRINTVLP